MLKFALAIVLVSRAVAQPQFEVASVRQTESAPGSEGGRERVEVTSTAVTLRNASLSFLIQWAYGVRFYQVAGPDWLKDQRYDVQAKPASPSSERDLRLMMRAFLADRFRTVLYEEQQPRPVYALVAREQPKLEPASPDASGSFSVANGDFVFQAVTMTEFADQLSDLATVDWPVLDKTGLAGRFDFKLDSAARAIRGGEGPSIFTAVSELGLQIKPANELVRIIVVQSAEKRPSAN